MDREDLYCPYFHQAVEIVGARWTGAIIKAMLGGATRFNQLTAAVQGLSDRMLSERLKELESWGIVGRLVVPETPVRVEYHLTDMGLALADVVSSVGAWADRWLAPKKSSTRRHK